MPGERLGAVSLAWLLLGLLVFFITTKKENFCNMKTKIKEFRAKYNLTQEELARQVGVRRETIVFLEQGKYIPSLKLAWDVAKVLKTTIDELFIFDDKKNKTI